MGSLETAKAAIDRTIATAKIVSPPFGARQLADLHAAVVTLRDGEDDNAIWFAQNALYADNDLELTDPKLPPTVSPTLEALHDSLWQGPLFEALPAAETVQGD